MANRVSDENITGDNAVLGDLLTAFDNAAKSDASVTIGQLLDLAGSRSFGAMLLVPSLALVTPLSGIPGMASALAVLIILIAWQVLIGREEPWLPQWVVCRGIDAARIRTAVRWSRRPAGWVDNITRSRWRRLTRRKGTRVGAAASILLALMVPPLDLVPFANTLTGLALTCIALGLLIHDGALYLIGIGVVFGVIAMLVQVFGGS